MEDRDSKEVLDKNRKGVDNGKNGEAKHTVGNFGFGTADGIAVATGVDPLDAVDDNAHEEDQGADNEGPADALGDKSENVGNGEWGIVASLEKFGLKISDGS